MGSRPRAHRGRSPFLLGAFVLVALLALGSGHWAIEPVSAQRSTAPTRTPLPVAQPEQPTLDPFITPTATPEVTPTVAPVAVLPHVGAMWEPAGR